MKNFRFFIAACLLMMMSASCKKDNIENGPFSIEPKDFFSAKKYSSLVVEIAYISGHQPTNDAVNHVLSELNKRLNKPAGIRVVYTQVPSPRRSSYTIGDIDKIEKDYRTQFTKHDKLTAFVFFADAAYAGDDGVLGLAYGTSSVVVFESRIEDYSGGLSQPSQPALEATVIEHEFGHLFGLVDNGTPMATAHKDAANGHHCDNQNCLMYYSVETIDFAAVLTGGNIPELDEHCLADLRANGGK